MKSSIAAVTLLAAAVFSGTTEAQPQWCQGTLNSVWIDTYGSVFTQPSWHGSHLRICNLRDNTGGVDTVTCSSWHSVLAEAVSKQLPTIIYYPDVPSCDAIPTYTNAPVPYYVMLRSPNAQN